MIINVLYELLCNNWYSKMIDRTKSNFELSTIFHDENVTAQLNFDIFDQNFEKS